MRPSAATTAAWPLRPVASTAPSSAQAVPDHVLTTGSQALPSVVLLPPRTTALPANDTAAKSSSPRAIAVPAAELRHRGAAAALVEIVRAERPGLGRRVVVLGAVAGDAAVVDVAAGHRDAAARQRRGARPGARLFERRLGGPLIGERIVAVDLGALGLWRRAGVKAADGPQPPVAGLHRRQV